MHLTQNPVSEVEQTPADHLRHAALYLTRYGWTQLDFYSWSDQDEVLLPSACLVGAIRVAVCGRACSSADTNSQDREIRAAMYLIAEHLGLGPDNECDAVDVEAAEIEARLAGWNDKEERTCEQVLAELTAAADAYDRDAAALAYFDAFPGGAR